MGSRQAEEVTNQSRDVETPANNGDKPDWVGDAGLAGKPPVGNETKPDHSETSLSQTIQSSIDKLGFFRNPEAEKELAKEMVKLHDQDPASADKAWSQARTYAGLRRGVSLGDAQSVYNRVVELSGEEKDSQKGWERYGKIEDNLASAMKEDLKTEDSRKKATEHFVNALGVDESIATWMIRGNTGNYELLADLGSKYGKNIAQVRQDAMAVQAIKNESGAEFPEAYAKLKNVGELTAEARKVLAKSDSTENMQKAAEIIGQAMNESVAATIGKIGPGEVPLLETETGSAFYRAVMMAKEKREGK